MQLTKEEAIRRHRMMWNWIAEESIRQKGTVYKEDAFEHFGWEPCENNCWCCEYNELNDGINCSKCPVVWPCVYCVSPKSPFRRYSYSSNYIEDAKYAKQIAELPERED